MRTVGNQVFEDTKRKRFVVYRTKNRKVFKTSVRYKSVRTKAQARELALAKASELRSQ